MGEYFEWVNIDKKEYISPFDFDQGSKLHQTSVDGNPLLNALATLLDDRWKGDRIVFLGDIFGYYYDQEECGGYRE